MNTLKSSPWPRAILSSFIALALFDAVIVYLAINSRTDVIEEHPYQAGLDYEQIVEAKRASRLDGLKVHFAIHQGKLSVECTGCAPGSSWQTELKLVRPNDATLDQFHKDVMTVPEIGQNLPALQPGLWIVQLWLQSPPKRYFFESQVLAPAAG